MIEMEHTQIVLEGDETEYDDILHNLRNLYRTPAGSIPLDRDLGMSQDFLDYPIPIAENMVSLEVIEKTEKYEPRVEVVEITFSSDLDGKMTPIIKIKKVEEGVERDGRKSIRDDR